MNNIVILISGGGSNMRSICKEAKLRNWQSKYDARIAAVISNKSLATGLDWAKKQGIETRVVEHQSFATREEFDMALIKAVDQYKPSLLVLAGFMRILTANFIKHYEGKIINIHPSLLPTFKGTQAQQRAIQAGCKFSGATVHEVTEDVDCGAIIDQVVVPILHTDDVTSLSQRILSQEHILYPRAIEIKLQQLTNKN